MSYVATRSYGVQSTGSLGRFVSSFLKLAASPKRWMHLRAVERHLESLDDRLLKDIGLARTDIHSAVWRGREHSNSIS